jgi:hypothetical protein
MFVLVPPWLRTVHVITSNYVIRGAILVSLYVYLSNSTHFRLQLYNINDFFWESGVHRRVSHFKAKSATRDTMRYHVPVKYINDSMVMEDMSI